MQAQGLQVIAQMAQACAKVSTGRNNVDAELEKSVAKVNQTNNLLERYRGEGSLRAQLAPLQESNEWLFAKVDEVTKVVEHKNIGVVDSLEAVVKEDGVMAALEAGCAMVKHSLGLYAEEMHQLQEQVDRQTAFLLLETGFVRPMTIAC